MKKTSKIICTILSLIMIIGVLPTVSFAETAVPTELSWEEYHGVASIVPIEGVEVYLFELYKDSVKIDQNTMEDEAENFEDSDGAGISFGDTIEKAGSGRYTFRVGVCSDTYEEYTEHWDMDALNVIAWSDYSEELVYTGGSLSGDKNTANTTTSQSSNADETETTSQSSDTATTTTETNTEMAEMDASVIDPKYTTAVRTMYHLGIMPNVYRDYNKAVKTEEFAEIIYKISGSTIEVPANSVVPCYIVLEKMITVLGYYSDIKGWNDTRDIIKYAIGLGIFSGNNSDAPNAVTHEELAGIIYRALFVNLKQVTSFGEDPVEKVTDTTLFQKLGYTQAELDEIAERTDVPVYAEAEVTAPSTSIKLTINNPVATVNGENITNDVAPIIRNSRTMLPIRFVAEALGATVGWDGATSTVSITASEVSISIVVGNSFATVNGETIALDSPSFIEKGRTYLPLRFVSEKLGANVEWDGNTRSISITK